MASSPASDAKPAFASDWTAYAPLDARWSEQLRAALGDLREAIRRHRSWTYLAVRAVKNQYRRTVLGPWWLTLQTAVYVVGLGLIFGQLLGSGLREFVPYVAVGFITFTLLAGLTRAGANVFTTSSSVLKSTRQPLVSLVLRDVTVELIQFGHNLLIVALFFAFGLITPSVWLALAPFALLAILVNGVAVALWLGPLVARFRDVGPAVDSVLQVLIFFTPVFYKASDLRGAQSALVGWNPFTYFVELFRSAMLGHHPSTQNIVGAGAFTVANLVIAVLVFARGRSRLPYWVA